MTEHLRAQNKSSLIENSLRILVLIACKCILLVILILCLMTLIAIRACLLPAQGRRQLRSPIGVTSAKQFLCKWDANRKLVNLASWRSQLARCMQITCKWHQQAAFPQKGRKRGWALLSWYLQVGQGEHRGRAQKAQAHMQRLAQVKHHTDNSWCVWSRHRFKAQNTTDIHLPLKWRFGQKTNLHSFSPLTPNVVSQPRQAWGLKPPPLMWHRSYETNVAK